TWLPSLAIELLLLLSSSSMKMPRHTTASVHQRRPWEPILRPPGGAHAKPVRSSGDDRLGARGEPGDREAAGRARLPARPPRGLREGVRRLPLAGARDVQLGAGLVRLRGRRGR